MRRSTAVGLSIWHILMGRNSTRVPIRFVPLACNLVKPLQMSVFPSLFQSLYTDAHTYFFLSSMHLYFCLLTNCYSWSLEFLIFYSKFSTILCYIVYRTTKIWIFPVLIYTHIISYMWEIFLLYQFQYPLILSNMHIHANNLDKNCRSWFRL